VVWGNVVRGCEDDAAVHISGNNALVRGNTVAQTGDDLIEVLGDRARIIKNKGRSAEYDCIDVSGDLVRVQGNRMSGCHGSGAYVDGNHPKVINNRFGGNSDHGIMAHCSIACGKTVIKGNAIRDQYDDARGMYVLITGTGRALVRDNLVVGSPGSGMELAVYRGRIIGNVVRDVGYEREDAFIIYGDGNLVRGNRALGNGGVGILVEGGSNRLEGNVARGNHRTGIYINPYAGNKLIANVATKNKTNGIYNAGSDTVLRRNRALGNRRDCANDGTIAAKAKNRCADKSNFTQTGVFSRARAKKRR